MKTILTISRSAAIIYFPLIISIAFFYPAPIAAQPDTNCATALSITGPTSITVDAGKTWAPLAPGATLTAGDEIKTGSDGAVDLELPDGSILKIGPDSLVIIREMLRVEVINTTQTTLEIIFGKIRAVVGPITDKNSHFTIETENSTIGVRGTDFGVSYNPDVGETELFCFEGDVVLTPKESFLKSFSPEIREKILRSYLVNKNRRLAIMTGRAPGAIERLKEAHKKQVLAGLEFKNERVLEKIELIKKRRELRENRRKIIRKHFLN